MAMTGRYPDYNFRTLFACIEKSSSTFGLLGTVWGCVCVGGGVTGTGFIVVCSVVQTLVYLFMIV